MLTSHVHIIAEHNLVRLHTRRVVAYSFSSLVVLVPLVCQMKIPDAICQMPDFGSKWMQDVYTIGSVWTLLLFSASAEKL